MDENQTLPYSSMLNAPAMPPAQAPGGMPFTGMSQPTPDIASEMNRPAANAEELSRRKQGWMQVLQDPNFKRALGYAGAYMLQPRAQGQSVLGHLAGAYTVGQTAYDLGQGDQRNQQRQDKADTRAEVESEANVAGTRARTAGTEASTANANAARPGIAADAEVAARTATDRIAKAKLDREAAERAAKKAESVEEVDALEREAKKRKLGLVKEIPDAKLRAAAEAEVDAEILRVTEARARINAANASRDASNAARKKSELGTKQDEMTLEVLEAMPKEERKQFFTKTGTYSATTSGIGQQANMWGDIYDKLPATDTNKKGKTREQFQMEQLQSAKKANAATNLKNYISAVTSANMDPDPEIVGALTAEIKAGTRTGGASGSFEKPPAGAKPKITNAAEYNALPKGTKYIDPDGVERTKR